MDRNENNKEKLFGGLTMVLEDLRQILSVIRKGWRNDIIQESINTSISGNISTS